MLERQGYPVLVLAGDRVAGWGSPCPGPGQGGQSRGGVVQGEAEWGLPCPGPGWGYPVLVLAGTDRVEVG